MTQNRTEHALKLAHKRYQDRCSRAPRNFITIEDISKDTLTKWIEVGLDMKSNSEKYKTALSNKYIGLLFQKTSTRTRCSFETAEAELGGKTSYIQWDTSNFVLADLQDEIRVFSRYFDAIMARVNEHDTLLEMCEHSESPIISGLCNKMHPCQALSDALTITEYFGPDLGGLNVVYIGDGNNVARSLRHVCTTLNMNFTLCCPDEYSLPEWDDYKTTPDVSNADVIYTDTWVSMGDEAETAQRLIDFKDFQVNADLLKTAPEHALILHCLPAHPGQEITADVLRSPRSVVFDQAENRKHAQKSLLYHLLRP